MLYLGQFGLSARVSQVKVLIVRSAQKEIERLRKWLREFQFREREKSEPVWTWEDGFRWAALPGRTVGAE